MLTFWTYADKSGTTLTIKLFVYTVEEAFKILAKHNVDDFSCGWRFQIGFEFTLFAIETSKIQRQTISRRP